MVVLVGVGIEQWFQIIVCGGGGRGDDLGVVEEIVVYVEVQVLVWGEVGGGQGEGVVVVLQYCGCVFGQVFVGFGVQWFVVGVVFVQKECCQEIGEWYGR